MADDWDIWQANDLDSGGVSDADAAFWASLDIRRDCVWHVNGKDLIVRGTGEV